MIIKNRNILKLRIDKILYALIIFLFVAFAKKKKAVAIYSLSHRVTKYFLLYYSIIILSVYTAFLVLPITFTK